MRHKHNHHGHPAFPIHPRVQILGRDYVGMSTREFYSALAMAKLATLRRDPKTTAKLAIKHADALVAELNGGVS